MTPLVARENPPLALDGFGQILRSLLSQVTSHMDARSEEILEEWLILRPASFTTGIRSP
jgi:hypothetical protein